MEEYRNDIPEKKGTDASFVLGILSIVFGVVCQVVGLILGIIGLNKAKDKSETGWTLSVIGIVLNAVIIAATVIGIIILLILFNGIMDSFYYW